MMMKTIFAALMFVAVSGAAARSDGDIRNLLVPVSSHLAVVEVHNNTGSQLDLYLDGEYQGQAPANNWVTFAAEFGEHNFSFVDPANGTSTALRINVDTNPYRIPINE